MPLPPLSSRAASARFAVLALILVAFFLGRALAPSQAPASGAVVPTSGEDAHAAPSFWLCPMGDIPPVPREGKCPICGMTLVPAPGAAENAGEAPALLALSEEDARRAGIRLAPVERKPVRREIPLYGRIEYDPGYFAEVSAFTGGVIDKVYVRRVGEWLRPEQKLFDFWSQEIYSIEYELLELAKKIPAYVAETLGAPLGRNIEEPEAQARSLRARTDLRQQRQTGRPTIQNSDQASAPLGQTPTAQGAQAQAEDKSVPVLSEREAAETQRRFAALRFRLRSYGLTDAEINQTLKQQQPAGILPVRLQSVANIAGGVALENRLTPGRWVNPGEILMVVADSRFIWANMEGFESDFPWIRFGQEVRLTTEARPGEVLTGKVSQLSPNIDPDRRTYNLGVVLDPETKLRPNMTVRGSLIAMLDKDGRVASEDLPLDRAPLVAPAEAPLLTGERAVVWVAVPGRRNVFERRDVILGPKADQGYVVKDGLAEGEMVVVNGAFKIDSEAQIQGRPSMLNARPRQAVAPTKPDPSVVWPAPAPQYSPPGALFQAPPPRHEEDAERPAPPTSGNEALP